jgi:tetratricopeptide (TPR) repeat protein
MVADTLESLWQRAKEAIEKQEWDVARPLLHQALGMKSDSPDLHYNLATVSFQLEDLTNAAYHFKEVTRLDPLRAGAYINLGAIYNLLDQFDDAISVLRRGLQLDPHRSEGYYNLGLVYRRKNQKDMAIQAYREAIRVNPRMVDAYFNLGNMLLDKQQFGPAATAYKQALQLRPNWDRAMNGLKQSEAGLAAASQVRSTQPAPGTAVMKPLTEEVRKPTAAVDPEKMINPNVHGTLLNNLHRATIDSENHGRHFLKILESEVEPAIKELSTCLLYPNSPASELGACVQRFENAMQNMRSLQHELQSCIERIRTLGDKMVET